MSRNEVDSQLLEQTKANGSRGAPLSTCPSRKSVRSPEGCERRKHREGDASKHGRFAALVKKPKDSSPSGTKAQTAAWCSFIHITNGTMYMHERVSECIQDSRQQRPAVMHGDFLGDSNI
jgi:hypothetical protein